MLFNGTVKIINRIESQIHQGAQGLIKWMSSIELFNIIVAKDEKAKTVAEGLTHSLVANGVDHLD